MDYGTLHLRIDELLKERNISKNQLCRDLNIPRTNLNRYCRDDVARLDVMFICKLCFYFGISAGDLIEYRSPEKFDSGNNELE